MELAPVTGSIVLDDAAAIAAERNVAREASAMKQAVESESHAAAAAMESSFKQGLDHIKESFGKRSVFGESIELLAGGGVIAGVGLAARELEDMTRSLADFSDAMRKGSLSNDELDDKLIRLVPVLGQVYAAGQNVKEIFTGQNAAIEEQAIELKNLAAAWGDVVKELQGMEAAGKSTEKSLDDMRVKANQATAIDRAPNAQIADIQRVSFKFDDQQKAIDDALQPFADKVTQLQGKLAAASPFDSSFKQLGTELAAAQSIYAQMQEQAKAARQAITSEFDADLDALQKQRDALADTAAKAAQEKETAKAAEAAAKLQSEADAVIQSLRTPDEIFGDKIRELEKLHDANLIDAEKVQRGENDALRQLNAQLGNHGISNQRNQAQDLFEGHTVTASDVTQQALDTIAENSKKQVDLLSTVVDNTDPDNTDLPQVEIPPA